MLESLKTCFPRRARPFAQQLEAFFSNLRRPTGHFGYSENRYGKVARVTGVALRSTLLGYQIPAILEHFGRLDGAVFLDIGAGDIVLGDQTEELGMPEIFFAQDLSTPSLEEGLKRLRKSGFPTGHIVTLSSLDFNFEAIPRESIDLAFSNSLFSHLSLNSILLCLENLGPRMKSGSAYLSSMIVAPEGSHKTSVSWPYAGGTIRSYPTSDPYHYSNQTIQALSSLNPFFEVAKIHEYGHPFQKLVEFKRRGGR